MACDDFARFDALVQYDPLTGIFTRKATTRPQSARYVGQQIGYVNTNGYVVIGLKQKGYRAHRVAWLLMTGEWPAADIDHTNGDRADNRWSNLRAATRRENLQNTGLRKSNTSGVKGVSFDAARKKWVAQMRLPGKQRFLGRFSTKEEAAAAYHAEAERLFGEFARAA